jgi:hypothetical protein
MQIVEQALSTEICRFERYGILPATTAQGASIAIPRALGTIWAWRSMICCKVSGNVKYAYSLSKIEKQQLLIEYTRTICDVKLENWQDPGCNIRKEDKKHELARLDGLLILRELNSEDVTIARTRRMTLSLYSRRFLPAV